MAWVFLAQNVRIVTRGVSVAERLAGVVCLLTVSCAGQASATVGRKFGPYASAFGLPEYGAAANAGVIPTDGPQGVNFLAVGDFNGDGRDDVMVVRVLYQSSRTFQVVVLVNQGNGTFVDQTSSVFDGAPPQTLDARRVVVADFNGDGRPDVFIADEGQDVTPSYGHQNTLILSAPGGKLVDSTANLPQRSDFSHALAAADVNGDGSPDLFVGNLGGADSSILLNDGSGHFHDEPNGVPANLADPGRSIITSAVFADVNHDGFPDLIVGGGSNGLYSTVPVVLLNNGHGAFPSVSSTLPLPPYGFNSPVDFQTADLNGDGYPDVIASYVKTPGSTGRWIQVLINKGDGTFKDETRRRLPQGSNSSSWIKAIQLIDLNGDGALDIATAVVPNGPPYDEPPPFYLNDGHGNFTALPLGLDTRAGDTYNFIDASGQRERDIIFTLNNSDLELLREQTPNGHRLYATVAPNGAVSLVSDQGSLAQIKAGNHQLVVWDQDPHASFRLTGPGVNALASAGSGISFLFVRLRAGATYRYSGRPGHQGTIRIRRSTRGQSRRLSPAPVNWRLTTRASFTAREHSGQSWESRRKVRTASTRRWAESSAKRPSFVKMRWTCVSTVLGERWSRLATPWFDCPSAISVSTSCSRSVRSASGSFSRRRLRRRETTSGSIAEPPSPTRWIAAQNSWRSETRSLRR